jgi:hypothetical protein
MARVLRPASRAASSVLQHRDALTAVCAPGDGRNPVPVDDQPATGFDRDFHSPVSSGHFDYLKAALLLALRRLE